MKRLGVLLAVLSVLLGIGGVWWWALLGMTPQVGGALCATACGMFIGGLVALFDADMKS